MPQPTHNIAQHKEEIEELIENGTLGLSSSYSGSPYRATGGLPYQFRQNWGHNRSDLNAALRYLALTPISEEIQMADALGILDAPRVPYEQADTTLILTTTPENMGLIIAEYPELAEEIDKLEIVYDTKDHPELVPAKERSWGSVLGTYSGDIPDNIAYFACRNRALVAANSFWRSNQVVKREYPKSSLKELKSLKKSESLINALLLGHERMHLTQRRGKVKSGTNHTLLSIEYLSDKLPEEVATSTRALNMFDDVSRLWKAALSDAMIALAVDEEDLLDEKTFAQKMGRMSEFTLMEQFLDAYLAGVPADDILV